MLLLMDEYAALKTVSCGAGVCDKFSVLSIMLSYGHCLICGGKKKILAAAWFLPLRQVPSFKKWEKKVKAHSLWCWISANNLCLILS